jgi:hypothetical protein
MSLAHSGEDTMNRGSWGSLCVEFAATLPYSGI